MGKGRRAAWVGLVVTTLYVGSYLALSRRGFADADRENIKGFYFFPAADTTAWRVLHGGCVLLYYPLIQVDRLIGTGRHPASEPLWGLEACGQVGDLCHLGTV